jgi:hypothetical protein
MDKEQAIIDFLMTCPKIYGTPLYFNFASIRDNTKQLITMANEKALQKPYIDGSVWKRYTLTLIDFKSVTYQPVISTAVLSNENLEDFLQVQEIIDWIDNQNEIRNFPDFGPSCFVESVRALNDSPNLNGIDTRSNPQLAKYSISIQVDYLDESKMIWT